MNRLKDIVLSLLLLGIVVQGWVWLDRQSAESDTAQNDAVRLGDSLPFLRGTDRGQAPVSVRLSSGQQMATVLYVYHPDCGPCGTVAPAWAQHFSKLAAPNSPVRVIALTRAGFPAALEFADDFDWHVEIVSVDGLTMSPAERHLISRTPWVFVFDSNGVLRLQTHGADLDQVENTLALLSRAPNALHHTQTESRNP